MRRSKFLGNIYDGWICTRVAVADVQPAFCRRKVDGKRVRSKSPGSKQYSYELNRLTSDGKAMKNIVLTAAQMRKVARGLITVEEFSLQREAKRSLEYKERISYTFCD